MSADSSRVATSYEVSDFSKPLSTVGLSLADVQLTPDQLDLYIDLGPYANSSYYVVQVSVLSGLWKLVVLVDAPITSLGL